MGFIRLTLYTEGPSGPIAPTGRPENDHKIASMDDDSSRMLRCHAKEMPSASMSIQKDKDTKLASDMLVSWQSDHIFGTG